MVTSLVILVIGLPWIGALAVLMARDSHPRLQHFLAVGFTIISGIVSLILIPFSTTDTVIRIALGSPFGDLSFAPDGLGAFLSAIASVIGCLTVIFSVSYMRGEKQLGRYYALVLMFIGGMCGLVLTNNLFLLVLFWELVAFCSYALISFYNDNPAAVAGGLKALIITQIGGVGLLAGSLIVYGYLGTFEIGTLLAQARLMPASALAFVAFFFLAAAAAKSAQVPFHTWLPGAMEAPTPISALIHAATMVNAGVYLLARFYPAFAQVPYWTAAVITIGALSAVLAAMMALVATDIKRVLAYSTISQLGYMVYAVGVGGILASQFHLLSHAVFKALLFLMAGAVTHAVGTRDMRKMGGLSARMPYVRTMAWVGILALMGIPIFNGFWSKELILESGTESGLWLPFAMMIAGVILTALYSIRLMWMVFYAPPLIDPNLQTYHVHHTPLLMKAVLAVLAFGSLTTWLLIGPFSQLLAERLSYQAIETKSTASMISQVLTEPVTFAAWTLILIAFVIWVDRDRWLVSGKRVSQWIQNAAARDFGFEWLNGRISTGIQRSAAGIQVLQTGQLNWNLIGMMVGLVVVLLILGGTR